MQNQSLIHRKTQMEGIADSINYEDVQLMKHLIELRVLDTQRQQHKILLSFDGNSGLFPGWGVINIMEEFNVSMKHPMHEFISDNMLGTKSTGYSLINGVYRKIVDWKPLIHNY